MSHPNSLKNLTNIGEAGFTPEQLSENGKKGGIASGAARRARKEMKELALEILDMPLKGGKVEDFKNLAESKGKNISVAQAALLAQVKRAMAGDTKALQFLRDTAGMAPVEKKEISAKVQSTGKLDDIIQALNEKDE